MEDIGRLTLISLGSNEFSTWGDPRETVQKAMVALGQLSQTPIVNSRLYQTPAFPAGAGPDFVNAAAAIFTKMPAADLLGELHNVEADAGRLREVRWGQRTLDLDLIAMGDLVLPDVATQTHWRGLPVEMQQQKTPERVLVPHPRMQDRAFVLVPLADVAPDWRHPVLQLSVRELLADCSDDDIASVVALADTG